MSVPPKVAVTVAGDEPRFSTRASELIDPLLMMSTPVSVPTAGLKPWIVSARSKLVLVAG